MSNLNRLFRVSTFGESHCKAVGVIIEGCPPGLRISDSDIQTQLSRRRPGQSELTTPRNEADQVIILSGTEMGITLGSPIAMMVHNKDQKPHDYGEMDYFPRPSHADYTYLEKYSLKSSSGGGRASARETIGRVAAGAIAEKYLNLTHNIQIIAFVNSVGPIELDPTRAYSPATHDTWKSDWESWWSLLKNVTREQVDSSLIRCPDAVMAEEMKKVVVESKEAQDSIGGTIVCVIRNLPTGLGEPSFDKLEASLAHAMLSIPATKGFEIGSGFKGTTIPGHLHNDPFYKKENGSLGTTTNFSGGIQGGISNGEDIYFKVAFKSVATIGKPQQTATFQGNPGVLEAKGRHDPCVLPRAVPIVEAMASLIVMDALLIQLARKAAIALLPEDLDLPKALTGKLGLSDK